MRITGLSRQYLSFMIVGQDFAGGPKFVVSTQGGLKFLASREGNLL